MNAYRLILILAVACTLQACVTTSEPARPAPASDEEASLANLNLGAAYVREGRPDLAIEALERALSIDPQLSVAHSTIAIAYDQLSSFELAEEHYRRATELNRSDSGAANSYAVFLCRQGRWNDAEEYFIRAINDPRYPTPDIAMVNAGICARSSDDSGKADEYFRAALSKNSALPAALSGLMELAYDSGNFLRARAFMQRYLDSQPATSSVLWMCVQIERELDNPAAVQDCERRLVEQFPTSPEASRLQLSSDARTRR